MQRAADFFLPVLFALSVAQAPVRAADPRQRRSGSTRSPASLTRPVNTQRAQDWPEKVICGFRRSRVHLMILARPTAAVGQDWLEKQVRGARRRAARNAGRLGNRRGGPCDTDAHSRRACLPAGAHGPPAYTYLNRRCRHGRPQGDARSSARRDLVLVQGADATKASLWLASSHVGEPWKTPALRERQRDSRAHVGDGQWHQSDRPVRLHAAAKVKWSTCRASLGRRGRVATGRYRVCRRRSPRRSPTRLRGIVPDRDG